MSEKKSFNYVGIGTMVLVALAIVLGVMGYSKLSDKTDANERYIVEKLRSEVPASFDMDHVPCKQCRSSLNEGLSHAAHIERQEIIYVLRRAYRGQAGFDAGIRTAIDLVAMRGE